MIVIGIDPGTANTGFGVVRTSGERMVALDGGVIEIPADVSPEKRLARLHDSLGELIRWRAQGHGARGALLRQERRLGP
jgi:crossover junction endodeoxyribonuclease RuvC